MKYWKNYILKFYSNKLMLLVTFMMALLLYMFPLTYKFKWLMPNWIVLVLVYWIIFTPEDIDLGFIFALGVLIDLLLGNFLGITSLSLMPVKFVADRICSRFFNLTLLQQFLLVLLLISLNHLIKLCLQLYIKHPTNNLTYWLTIPSSIVGWPIVCGCLNLFRKVIKCY